MTACLSVLRWPSVQGYGGAPDRNVRPHRTNSSTAMHYLQHLCRVALAAVQGYGGAPDRNVRGRT
jgi:hypothetical protein